MKCPNCGSDSNGAFCSECGTPLKGAKCRSCKAPLPSGANYCTSCGTAVRETSGGVTAPVWYAAGAALVVLIAVVLLWPRGSGNATGNDGRMPISQIPEPAGDPAAMGAAQGPLTGTPREQADRLFNRIMTEQAGGDTTQARFFLPMALQAYDMAGELDADGLYHLSLLHALGGDYASARSTAEKVLASSPNHLLALSAAGNAARDQGDQAAAKKYYQRFLAAYNVESTRTDIPEYRDHGRAFPDLKAEAEKGS